MWTITLKTLCPLNATNSCCVILFPTILALWNFWIHVGSSDSSDKASYIEVSVDDFFCVSTTLRVPDIDPDDGHVEFGRNLDDMRSRSEDNVIEDVVAPENAFDIIWRNTRICVLIVVWNTYNFEIGLGLWKSRGRNLVCIRGEWVFDIFFNLL